MLKVAVPVACVSTGGTTSAPVSSAVKVLTGSKGARVVVVELDAVLEEASVTPVGPVVDVTASGDGGMVVESAAVGVEPPAVVGVTTVVVAVDRPAQPARASNMVRRRIRERVFFTV